MQSFAYSRFVSSWMLTSVCVVLVGCGQSISLSRNELAKKVAGTWVGSHSFATNPDGSSDTLYQEFAFTLAPDTIQHGTWVYRSSRDGVQWEVVGDGTWTVLPQEGGDMNNYTSKSNGKFDLRVERCMRSDGAAKDLFNKSCGRRWVDFDGMTFTDVDQRFGDSKSF